MHSQTRENYHQIIILWLIFSYLQGVHLYNEGNIMITISIIVYMQLDLHINIKIL